MTVTEVPVPLNCTDGFIEAFYGRPEAFLDADVRAGQSAWGFVGQNGIDRGCHGWPMTCSRAAGTPSRGREPRSGSSLPPGQLAEGMRSRSR